MSDATTAPNAAGPIEVSKAVAEPCAAYMRRAEDWDLVSTLLAGTRAMRDAGEKYLPKADAEETSDYDARLKRSFLFDGFKRVVASLAGKPFKRPIGIGDDVPEDLRAMLENVDLRGTHLVVMAARLLHNLLSHGSVHLLVDFPNAEPSESLADERARELRPYAVLVAAQDLIGWQHEYVDGHPVLMQARIREWVTEAGEFGEQEVEQIRLIEPGFWRVFRKAEKGESWVLHDGGETTLPIVPLVTMTAPSAEMMTADPPLMGLAWLNVEHWQSSSDQRHILHTARCPFLLATGFSDPEDIVVGPNSLVTTTNDQASLRYVEHTGAAIDAGAKDLASIEEKMAAHGVEMLRPLAAATATQSTINADGATSMLGLLVDAMVDGLENGLSVMSLWLKRGADQGGSIQIDRNWILDAKRDADVASLIQMKSGNQISHLTFLAELKRRGFFADDFDAETELALIDEEALSSAETFAATSAIAGSFGQDTAAGGEDTAAGGGAGDEAGA